VSLVEWVARYNGLGDANRIVAGETLIVPDQSILEEFAARNADEVFPKTVPLGAARSGSAMTLRPTGGS